MSLLFHLGMEARSSQCLQSLHEDNGTSRMGLRLRQGPRLLHGSRPRFDRSVEPGVRKNAKERCEMAFASTLMRIRFTCEPVPFIGVLRAFRTKHSVVNGGSGNAGRCRHAVRWDAGFRRPGPLPITRPYVKSARPRFDSRREIPFASTTEGRSSPTQNQTDCVCRFVGLHERERYPSISLAIRFPNIGFRSVVGDFSLTGPPQPQAHVGFVDQSAAISRATRRVAQARFIDSDLPADFVSIPGSYQSYYLGIAFDFQSSILKDGIAPISRTFFVCNRSNTETAKRLHRAMKPGLYQIPDCRALGQSSKSIQPPGDLEVGW